MQFVHDEKKWFRDVFDAHYDYIRNYLYYLSGNLELSEDLVQDVFAKLWEERSKVKQETILALLFTIARNLYFKTRRRTALDLKFISSFVDGTKPDSPEYLLELKEFEQKLQVAISGLPEKTRTAFLLSRIDGKSYAEIAEGFGLSIKAIEKHISHAKKILREQLGHNL